MTEPLPNPVNVARVFDAIAPVYEAGTGVPLRVGPDGNVQADAFITNPVLDVNLVSPNPVNVKIVASPIIGPPSANNITSGTPYRLAVNGPCWLNSFTVWNEAAPTAAEFFKLGDSNTGANPAGVVVPFIRIPMSVVPLREMVQLVQTPLFLSQGLVLWVTGGAANLDATPPTAGTNLYYNFFACGA